MSAIPAASTRSAPSTWLIVAAFFSLYFFWGSTYLGIKWGLTGFPAFFLAGTRNFLAGLAMYAFARSALGGSAPRPTVRHWRNALIVGGLLLVGGNGLVTFATQYIPSNLAALLVSTLPIWMAVLDRSSGPDGAPPRRGTIEIAGILTGFAGVAVLLAPKILDAFTEHDLGHGGGTQAAVSLLVLCSSFLWATGSLYGRKIGPRGGLPSSPLLTVGMQLICGGFLALVISALRGEWGELSWARITASPTPLLSLIYLIVFGSLVGFTSYIWLLGVTTPSRVATYAYVNPLVAVVLGWSLAGEALTPTTTAAAVIILGSVAAIVTGKARAGRIPAAKGVESADPESCGDLANEPQPDPADTREVAVASAERGG